MSGRRQPHQATARPLSPRQEQIVHAALRIIAGKGPRRFTAQLLTMEVGFTGGALYRHFASMEAVVDAVVDRVEAILFAGFPPEAADPIDRLRLFFSRRTQSILAHPDISRLLHSDVLAQVGGTAQAKRVGEFKKRTQSFIGSCLAEAYERNLLADDLEPQAASLAVIGSVLALSHAAPQLARAEDGGRLPNMLWAGLERMLRRAPRAGRSGAKQIRRAAKARD